MQTQEVETETQIETQTASPMLEENLDTRCGKLLNPREAAELYRRAGFAPIKVEPPRVRRRLG
jgi:hypothetical protein